MADTVKMIAKTSKSAEGEGISNHTNRLQRRAIEDDFPVQIVSNIGSNERYLHGRTPHSIHVWWARRPFTAMRAIVFSTLAPCSSEVSTLTEQLVESLSPSTVALTKGSEVLSKAYGRPPRVLDIFSGGGTIPFEAARLGCATVSLELNPLAVFLQRTILQYSQILSDLPVLVESYGKELLKKVESETDETYRRGRQPTEKRLVFIWGQTVKCQKCDKRISLSRMGWISKKKNRTVFLEQRPDPNSGAYIRNLHNNPVSLPFLSQWKTTTGLLCPFCHNYYNKTDFQKLTYNTLHDELLLVCNAGNGGKYKTYVLPINTDDFYPTQAALDSAIANEVNQIGVSLPNTHFPVWSGIVNPPLYGIRMHMQMFNPRQLLVLLKMIRALRETYHCIASESSSDVAIAVTSVLSGFVDQLVDWNCRLSMWIEENEQVGRALSGPGIPMLWNYAETDPFSSGPANLYDKLARMITSLQTIPRFDAPIDIHLGSATEPPFSGKFDAIITDPPYGDNLFYSVLANCIYVWKRMVFRDILPDIFRPEEISDEKEIVAAHFGRASFSEAMDYYEENLSKALTRAVNMLDSNGLLSFVFAHSTVQAWEVVIRAFRRAKLVASACWPMTIERRARPRGMRSRAVNVSFVIVGRPSTVEIEERDWEWVRTQVEQEVLDLRTRLSAIGWSEADIGIACFGRAASLFTKMDCREDGKVLPLGRSLERTVNLIMKHVPALILQKRTTA